MQKKPVYQLQSWLRKMERVTNKIYITSWNLSFYRQLPFDINCSNIFFNPSTRVMEIKIKIYAISKSKLKVVIMTLFQYCLPVIYSPSQQFPSPFYCFLITITIQQSPNKKQECNSTLCLQTLNYSSIACYSVLLLILYYCFVTCLDLLRDLILIIVVSTCDVVLLSWPKSWFGIFHMIQWKKTQKNFLATQQFFLLELISPT